jgi:hypothetical protein
MISEGAWTFVKVVVLTVCFLGIIGGTMAMRILWPVRDCRLKWRFLLGARQNLPSLPRL